MAAQAAAGGKARDTAAEIAFLTRALKAPALRESAGRLADRARAESWTHEEFLAACLQREVAARESHGGEGRIRAARFPARKSLEEFDFDHARGLKRDLVAHLGTLDFVTARENVVFLGPPGTGKTHLATGLAIRACQAGHRVLFATASEWVARLADAHHAGRLQAELARLGRYPLLAIDEVGYIPFEPGAANLFFQLVSARYERASLIVTSNKPLRPVGRDLRRRRGRRSHDRPPRPPRRSHRTERRQLQAQGQGPRSRPSGRNQRRLARTSQEGVKIQPPQEGQNSGVVDTPARSERSTRAQGACQPFFLVSRWWLSLCPPPRGERCASPQMATGFASAQGARSYA